MHAQTGRYYTLMDKICIKTSQLMRGLSADSSAATRPRPDVNVAEATTLAPRQRTLAGRLMRINHSGEVCAQALYQGQALVARDAGIADKLQHAAQEEVDHLAWCAGRLQELDTRPSRLNPCWYLGSLGIGMVAGMLGDRISLGFLAETEHQVAAHLDSHLQRLPEADKKSRTIVATMREEEQQHATTALGAGGVGFPKPVQLGMRLMSKVMTKTAYWV